MSTQSFPVMAVLQIMTDGKERTKSANVAHGRSRSTATRSETDPSSAGEGDFVIWRYLRTLGYDQSHVLWTQWYVRKICSAVAHAITCQHRM